MATNPATSDNPSGIQPIAGFMIVRLAMSETESRLKASGLVMPDEIRERTHEASMAGEVLAVADDVRYGIVPGDRIVFGRYAGTTVKGMDGEDYRMVQDDNVKGIYHGVG